MKTPKAYTLDSVGENVFLLQSCHEGVSLEGLQQDRKEVVFFFYVRLLSAALETLSTSKKRLTGQVPFLTS